MPADQSVDEEREESLFLCDQVFFDEDEGNFQL
jgi:hypothetical protein